MAKYCKNDGIALIFEVNSTEWYCPKCGQVYEDEYEIRYTFNENAMNLITLNDFREFNYLHQDFNKIIGRNISSKNLSTAINLMIESRNELLHFIYGNNLHSYKYQIMEFFNQYYNLIGNNSVKYIESVIIKILIMYYSLHSINVDIYDIIKKYINDNMISRPTKSKYENMLDFAKFIKENNSEMDEM